MDEQVRKLRAAVAALGPRKRGRQIPSSVHALAVAFAARGRAGGRSWKAMAREVGVSSESLRRWTRAAGSSAAGFEAAAMVPVAVREDEPRRPSGGESVVVAAAAAGRVSGPLVLVSPRGFRLEGLGLGEARLLLEALS